MLLHRRADVMLEQLKEINIEKFKSKVKMDPKTITLNIPKSDFIHFYS